MAAGLSAAMSMSAAPAEAASISPITCHFNVSTGCTPNWNFDIPGGESFGDSAIYHWGAYSLTLEFENVFGNFDITVTNEEVAQNSPLWTAWLVKFPGQVCVPISDVANTCVLFHFSGGTTPSPTTWTGNWTATVNWFRDTDPPYSDPHVVHARGDDCAGPNDGCTPNGQAVFDTDITVQGSYCNVECDPPTPPCEDSYYGCGGGDILLLLGLDDPEIAGTDDNFQTISVVSTPAPEPASLLLLGSGLSMFLYRRRRVAAARKNEPPAGTPS